MYARLGSQFYPSMGAGREPALALLKGGPALHQRALYF
jgi:hypothetical protein